MISNAMNIQILLVVCPFVDCMYGQLCTELKNFPQVLEDKRKISAILNISSDQGFLICVQQCGAMDDCRSVSFDSVSGICYHHADDGKANPDLLDYHTGFLFTSAKDWFPVKNDEKRVRSKMSTTQNPRSDYTTQETTSTSDHAVTSKALDRIDAMCAREMKDIAGYLSWYASNTLKGYKIHASNDAKLVTVHYEKCTQTCPFSSTFHSLFKDLATASAWTTAHKRIGKAQEAVDKQILLEKTYDQLLATGEVTLTLAQKLRDMCWYAGMSAANSRAGMRFKPGEYVARDKVYELLKSISQ